MPIDRRELAQLIPSLRRYARGLMGDQPTADDIVQDCLVLALDRERQFRGGNLAGWVLTILANVGRSRLRVRRRQPTVELDPEAAGGPDADPATRIGVMAALAALPEEQRQPLLLTAIEGFSYAETAAILAIPVGTVMSRIARARTALADRLDGAPAVTLRRVK
jgi:RNA polymerase sigma-70 factor (ECF subfamily)